MTINDNLMTKDDNFLMTINDNLMTINDNQMTKNDNFQMTINDNYRQQEKPH